MILAIQKVHIHGLLYTILYIVGHGTYISHIKKCSYISYTKMFMPVTLKSVHINYTKIFIPVTQ